VHGDPSWSGLARVSRPNDMGGKAEKAHLLMIRGLRYYLIRRAIVCRWSLKATSQPV